MITPPHQQSAHNQRIAILKGIGIVLMVIGHSGIAETVSHWIYMFHMPLFFFASGFLFNDKYLSAPISFFKKRIKGLYFPFLKWVLIFVLLHNVFTFVHINADYLTVFELKSQILDAFIFKYKESLVGGFWFLRELFCASIISLSALWLVDRIKKRFILPERKATLILGTFILIVLICAYVVSISPLHILTVSLLGSCYFLTGTLVKRLQFELSPLSGFLIIAFSIGLSLILNIDMSMLVATGNRLFIDFPVALACILAVFSLIKLIKWRFSNWLDYIGQHTMEILTFHFLCFKSVSLLIILLYGLEIDLLSSHPVIKDSPAWAWVLYTISGIVLPLFFTNIITVIRATCFKHKKIQA